METKPYAIQSPEDIAKEYGGNKQRIAQAAQIGLLDPTAAVLAGMFIDRMRGAQMQEQAPQRTIAQQVLAPQPAAPQMPAGAGLGATPQAAQLAAAYPAEGAPPPVPGPSMPQEEPMMAADGGLMSLPVDDAMFEPSYNSGGIVAFAAGTKDAIRSGITDEDARRLGYGSAEEYEAFARMRGNNPGVTSPVPSPSIEVIPLAPSFSNSIDRTASAVGETPRGGNYSTGVNSIRSGTNIFDNAGTEEVFLTQPKPGRSGPTPENAARLAPPVSDTYPDETARGSRASMTAPAVVDKGPAGNVKTVTDAEVAAAAVNADPKAAEAAVKKDGIPGLRAYVDQYKELISAVPEGEGLKEYKEYLKSLPGELDKRKKEDLWGALTQFGFNLAGSQSPYFLQAAGQAGAQTMPAITGAIKERRSAEAEARKSRAELDKMTRAEEIKAIEGGVKLYGDEQTRQAQLDAARMAANKPTDMRSYVADYVQSARAAGDKETPDAVLRQQGAEKYLNLYSASGARAAAALTQADVAVQQANTNIQDRARDNVDTSLAKNWNSPENKRIRELQKQDRQNNKEGNPSNLAGEYIQGLYKTEETRIRGSQPAPAAPAPAPAAASKPATGEVKSPSGKVIPAAAVAQLKAGDTPTARKQFDEVFGAGAAAKVLGK
jgi:hypothetical protein